MDTNTNKHKLLVATYTLGCKVNQYESNSMLQQFKEEGYEVVDFEDYADIYIVNTCTVTNESDKKCRQIIRRAKQRNKNAVLIVIGCYVNIARKELEEMEDIDLLLDNSEKNEIVQRVRLLIAQKGEEGKDLNLINEKCAEEDCHVYKGRTRATIKVQDGCDRFCTYCIVPYVRGKVKSTKLEDVIKEIEQIAYGGAKEIVVTGIHLASYKDGKNELIDLLEEINKINGIERIRLGSLEPKLITKEFVERLSKLEKICDQFHLSLQSGSDAVLKRMNRRYTTDEFIRFADLVKSYFPNVNLTTDVIVGFPGETEEEYLESYEFVKKINFFKLHVFKYSPKKGTKAANMPGQVINSIKEERSKKLIKLSEEMQRKIIETYVGKVVKVLFEETKEGYTKGHTANYMLIKVPKDESLENTIKEVVIENEAMIEIQ